MNLHDNKEIFGQYIMATTDFMGLRDTGIIEKDYFVTLFLKKIAEKQPHIIFKGGTSLSKCYKVIKRFSEDIDLNVHPGQDRPTEGQRRKLKEDIVFIIEGLGFKLMNPEQIRSRRDFNKYVIDYMSESADSFLNKYLIVETEVFIKSFPTEEMNASCFIFDFLSANSAEGEIMKYNLEPFTVQVQSIERSFIDKVFAICDYYLCAQAENHSRHIYDLYKIYSAIMFNNAFKGLVEEVRNVRKVHAACHSAKDGVNLQGLLKKIMDEDFYKSDYNQITDTMLFETVPYTEAVTVLQQIIESRCFPDV